MSNGFTPAAERALLEHSWPGGVRERRNRVERAVTLSQAARIGVEALFPFEAVDLGAVTPTLARCVIGPTVSTFAPYWRTPTAGWRKPQSCLVYRARPCSRRCASSTFSQMSRCPVHQGHPLPRQIQPVFSLYAYAVDTENDASCDERRGSSSIIDGGSRDGYAECGAASANNPERCRGAGKRCCVSQFINGTVAVDGIARVATEIEVRAQCPKDTRCSEDELVK